MNFTDIILGKFADFGKVKAGNVLRMKSLWDLFNSHPSMDTETFNLVMADLEKDEIITQKTVGVFEVQPLGEQLFKSL